MRKLLMLLSLITSTYVIGQTNYYITSVDGTKLFVREFGKGRPVIFLAGGPGLNADYMEAVWKNLSSKYRCIVLDQRGTGKSRLPSIDSVTISLKNYVNDLEALRKYLKVERLTLLGHSWGGMLSMEYSAEQPTHTEKLILLGSGGPSEKFFSYFSDNLYMRLHEEDLREEALLDSLKQHSLRAIWPGYFFDRKRGLATKPSSSDELFGQEGIWSYAIGNYISTSDKRIRLLKNYKSSVNIIQGRQDPIGESTAYEIKNVLPQSQIHFIEKCGHLLWLENDAQVKEFFDMLHSYLK